MKKKHLFIIVALIYFSALGLNSNGQTIDLNVNSCFTQVHSSNISLDNNYLFVSGSEWDHYLPDINVDLGYYFKVKGQVFRLGTGYRRIRLPFRLWPYLSFDDYKKEIQYKMNVFDVSLQYKLPVISKKLSVYTGINVLFGYYSDLTSSYREGAHHIKSQEDPITYELAISFGRAIQPIWKTRATYSLFEIKRSAIKLNAEFGYGIIHMVTAVGFYQINPDVRASNMSMTNGSNFKVGLAYSWSKKAKG